MASYSGLAQYADWADGFELMDVESKPGDTTITGLLREKTEFSLRPYLRTSMTIDQNKPGQPITSLKLFHVTTPLEFIPKDDPNWND